MPIENKPMHNISVTIGGKDVSREELTYFSSVQRLGNILPTASISIETSNLDLFDEITKELNKVKISLSSYSDKNKKLDEKKMSYVISKVNNAGASSSKTGVKVATVELMADAMGYLSNPKVKASESRDTNIPSFLSTLDCFGDGDGMLKLEIKDNLLDRATDAQSWIQFGVTGSEFVNYALNRAIVETNNNSDGDRREFTYSSMIDFNSEGKPTLSLMDIKLRTSSFPEATAKHHTKGSVPLTLGFGGNSNFIFHSHSSNILGAGESDSMWNKTSLIHNSEENTLLSRKAKQPKLFKDSMEILDEVKPGVMSMFSSNSRGSIEFTNSNHYNANKGVQRHQNTSTTSSLNKITHTLNFPYSFINIKPTDITHVEIPDNSGDNKNTPKTDKNLTGKYTVTLVEYVYDGMYLHTNIETGRDTFVKN